jgi:hypothetical protein
MTQVRTHCPGCHERVDTTKPWRTFGPFKAHRTCRIECGICGQEMTAPAVGRSHEIAIWLSAPAHAACKTAEREAMATPRRDTP